MQESTVAEKVCRIKETFVAYSSFVVVLLFFFYFWDVSTLIDALVSLPISIYHPLPFPNAFYLFRAVFLTSLLMSSLWFFWPPFTI